MSSTAPQYEERGGLLQRAHASSDTMNGMSGEAQSNPTTSTTTSITEHDFRFPRRPAEQKPGEVFSAKFGSSHLGAPTNSTTEAAGASASGLDKLDFSAAISARKELLR